MQYTYNDSFVHTITSTYGERGVQWLKQLPNIVANCVLEWQLTDLKPYDALTYNYVLSGMMHDKAIVLKIRCDLQELQREIAALHACAQYNCVKIIADSKALGAVLLERIVPGDSLTSLFPDDDKRATVLAADLIRTLHQAPIIGEFPTLQDGLPTFSKEPQELARFIDRALMLRNKLLLSELPSVLLHGDFHSGNILLSADNRWVVIDPAGIIGNPIYDIAIYIRNPLEKMIKVKQGKKIIEQRIKDFATLLGWQAQDIYEWTYLQAVSSAYWSIEDGLNVSNHVAFLDLLSSIDVL